jgi:hypothetical protein
MKKLLVIPFLFICIVSNATNYYVRAGGSDSSTGLSDAAAWASVAKVNSSMSLFKPGDAILFRRGEHGPMLQSLLESEEFRVIILLLVPMALGLNQ